ncbi:hypothetical protein AVEN_226303-1 [Araneus ventricosus]|uniref:Uncharacterized protein n=1 Tax=Araneus ventricosus TaxID=182803 RepID=A0A4Y2D936_ARAVE|nr:hypothetical protein AVEN_226303-1 [Araneus ventricosus]
MASFYLHSTVNYRNCFGLLKELEYYLYRKNCYNHGLSRHNYVERIAGEWNPNPLTGKTSSSKEHSRGKCTKDKGGEIELKLNYLFIKHDMGKVFTHMIIYKLDKRDLGFVSYLVKYQLTSRLKEVISIDIAHGRRANREGTPVAAFAHQYTA